MISDIKIVENLLPRGYADAIEQDLISSNFPWFYVNDVTNPDSYGTPGLSNLVHDFRINNNTEYYRYLKPVTYFIEDVIGHRVKDLLRIRIGFLQSFQAGHNDPHLDFVFPHITACYYVNDCDGDTVLFNETLADIDSTQIDDDVVRQYVKNNTFTEAARCTPAKNKLCVFNGHRFHASSHPITSYKRFVITFNFTI